MDEGHKHHIFTFGRGDFFGEIAFLDQIERSADALAVGETELRMLQEN
jgi:sulfate permease, SulP family